MVCANKIGIYQKLIFYLNSSGLMKRTLYKSKLE